MQLLINEACLLKSILLQLAVFGNLYGLVNMSLFLILANYVSALFAVQLLRGDLTDSNAMNFGEIYNSFLAMYQVRPPI